MRRQHLIGYASAVFRVQSLFASTARALSPLGLGVRIIDQTETEPAVLYESPLAAASAAPGAPVGTDQINVASRLWAVSLSPTPEYLSAFVDHRPMRGWWPGC